MIYIRGRGCALLTMYFRATHIFTLLESSPQIHNGDHFVNPVLSRSFNGEVSKRDRGKTEITSTKQFEIFANGVCCVLANEFRFFSRPKRRRGRRRRWA